MIHNKDKLDYIGIALMILTSGTYIWYQRLSPALSCVIFLLFSIFYKYKIKKPLYRSGFLYVLMIFFLLLISFLFKGDLYDNQVYGFAFMCFSSFLFISNIDFESFRQKYLYLVTLLCIYSLPIFLVYENFPNILSIDTSHGYLSCMGVTIGWEQPFERFSSIFHEPGACQISLNTALILYLDKIRNWDLNRKEKCSILIIILSLLATQSTSGYIVLAVLAFICLEKKITSKWSVFVIPIMIIVSLLIFRSSVIQNKLFNEEKDSKSLVVRTSDNIAMIQMIQEEPLFGYGLGTNRHLKRSEALGNFTNSNGWLYITSSLGVIWLILFLLYNFRGMQRLGYQRLVLLGVFVSFLIMQGVERFAEYPISYIFIYLQRNKTKLI